jgi:uncharacterized protein (TIGR02246 family)
VPRTIALRSGNKIFKAYEKGHQPWPGRPSALILAALHDWEPDMSEPTDVVDRQVAAYRDRDLERFLACYAPDVKVKDFDGNVLMDGLEAMRGQYGALFRDSPQLTADVPRRIVAGDYVVDEECGSGIVMAGFPPTEHIAVVYQVRNGLIHGVILLM